ncbi:TetR/AcrR family transcriptional regulator [Clostridium hydrogeniformans]|uniref:TetR/AcrR family transcriptional regulator n=1 Tax=Clostridium hydrogeniformans TaxID=349933 RepID=UPI000488954A|nr:TetR/AcrR family transcriptional regulator [Clostridium hydrogeniformans]
MKAVEENRSGKILEKKIIKEKNIYNAAYDLFTTKGINNTAVDDIVKKAGVAKGTFYLYFKDKYDIINKLILQKSKQVFSEAMDETEKRGIEDFEEMYLFFVDYIIGYFKENKIMLKLINKNFSWSVYKTALEKHEKYDEVDKTLGLFINNLMERGMDREEAELTLFMVVELVGSVCYSSIIHNEPVDIDTIKPILFKKILAMIRQD